jgi:hypothetical protein
MDMVVEVKIGEYYNTNTLTLFAVFGEIVKIPPES